MTSVSASCLILPPLSFVYVSLAARPLLIDGPLQLDPQADALRGQSINGVADRVDAAGPALVLLFGAGAWVMSIYGVSPTCMRVETNGNCDPSALTCSLPSASSTVCLLCLMFWASL